MRILALLATLGACASPPPDAYWGGSPQVAGGAVGVGRDSAGEACTQQALGGGADIFCGTWRHPAGHVRLGGAAAPAALAGLATASPWRMALNERYVCADPVATTILDTAGEFPAAVWRWNPGARRWLTATSRYLARGQHHVPSP